VILPQNHSDGFFRFGLKTGGDDFSGLASKPVATVSWFGPQNRQLRFGELCFKITAVVSWFVPQNQVGFGLSVAPQNRRRKDGAVHVLRFEGLLRL
jgi:hypothetical protein